MASKIWTGLAAAAVAARGGLAADTGSVYEQGGAWVFKPNVKDPQAVAWGTYSDWMGTKSGFGQLSIATNPAANDTAQLFAAGYLEAWLTQPRVWQQHANVATWIEGQFANGTLPPAFQAFYEAQDAWTGAQVAANAGTSRYWRGVGAVSAQFDGLAAGYAAAAPAAQALTRFQLQLLNSVGDLIDLIPALAPDDEVVFANHDWLHMNLTTFARRLRETTHCSALVKTDGAFTDLWFSHVAWFAFSTTIRIFKHYSFALEGVPGNQMSFSSYPGYLSSLDDFYAVWSSGLAVLETTNSVFNKALYKLVVPQSLFAWQRVRAANLLAASGGEWNATFGQHNSGTYNNQYMVVNVGSFAPGQALLPDTLWVVEQIPGMVVGGDVTQQLERGHWPSYNVAYWPAIYNASGYPQLLAARAADAAVELGVPVDAAVRDALRAPLGDLAGVSYQLAPRAQIFRRDAGKVNDTASFLSLMRSNAYKTDPLAKGSPWSAICSRGDLASSPVPDGCLDGKASAASMWASRVALAVNGPTTAGGTLPPFSWSQFPSAKVVGLPEVYNFDWDVMQPDW